MQGKVAALLRAEPLLGKIEHIGGAVPLLPRYDQDPSARLPAGDTRALPVRAPRARAPARRRPSEAPAALLRSYHPCVWRPYACSSAAGTRAAASLPPLIPGRRPPSVGARRPPRCVRL